MKLILLLFFCLGAASARPQGGPLATIKNFAFENLGLGEYKYNYETSDGQAKIEAGRIENEGTENEVQKVEGSYTYVGDDGQTYEVLYTADENGFQPYGEHIPQAASVRREPPPLGIPSAALASLAGK